MTMREKNDPLRNPAFEDILPETEYMEKFLSGELPDQEADEYLNAIRDHHDILDRLVDAVEMDTLLHARAVKNDIRVSRPTRNGEILSEKRVKTPFFRVLLCIALWICFTLAFYASSRYVSSFFDPSLPVDCPALTDCSIRILQDGKPLEGAYVTLYPHNKQLRVACGGTSDRDGFATIATNGFLTGVPDGEFLVTVSKIIIEGNEPAEAYFVVDPKLLSRATTPIHCRVAKGGNDTFCFDIGKVRKIPIDIGRNPDHRYENHRFGEILFSFYRPCRERESVDR